MKKKNRFTKSTSRSLSSRVYFPVWPAQVPRSTNIKYRSPCFARLRHWNPSFANETFGQSVSRCSFPNSARAPQSSKPRGAACRCAMNPIATSDLLPNIRKHQCSDDLFAVLAARAKGERLGWAPHLASPKPASRGTLQESTCADSAQRLSPREGSGEGVITLNPKAFELGGLGVGIRRSERAAWGALHPCAHSVETLNPKV